MLVCARVLQTLLTDLDEVVGEGRTPPCKERGGSVSGMIVLPVDAPMHEHLMICVRLCDEEMGGSRAGVPTRALCEAMIWLRDTVDLGAPKPSGEEFRWELCVDGTDASSCTVVAHVTYLVQTPRTPVKIKERLSVPLPVQPACQGVLQVTVLDGWFASGLLVVRCFPIVVCISPGNELPNRELIGKQDPYVVARLKLRQHPLNRIDGLGAPTVRFSHRTVPMPHRISMFDRLRS